MEKNPNPMRVLIVDDEETILWSLGEILRLRGDEYALAENAEQALRHLEKRPFDVMVTDLAMPGMNGIELVKKARTLAPGMVSIVLTGLGTRGDAIAALREGVYDFIEKPMRDVSVFTMALERAGGRARLVRERDDLLRSLKAKNLELEMSLSELHEAYERLQRQEQMMLGDLRQAQRMQERLLPSRFPPVAGMDFFGYYRPCERLGGDFFGVVPIDETRTAFYLADVAGHGVAAAMVTVILRELIHAERLLAPDSRIFENPTSALSFLNQGILDERFDPPLLVTMCYAVVDGARGEVSCACAGHPAPVLAPASGRTGLVPAFGQVLGVGPSEDFNVARMFLEPGDFLILYSDGVTETRDAAGRDLTEQGVVEHASRWRGMSAEAIGRALENAMRERRGDAPPTDDVAFLILNRLGAGARTADGTPGGGKVRVRMPEPARTEPPTAPDKPFAEGAGVRREAVIAGRTGEAFVLRLRGRISWQQAPALEILIRKGVRLGAGEIHVDLSACETMDSTILGMLFQHRGRLILHTPSKRLTQLFSEMGIRDQLTVRSGAAPKAEADIFETPNADGVAATDLILSAHEALMDASEENRKRFEPAVEMMRKRGERES